MAVRHKFSPRVQVLAPAPDGTCKVQQHFKDEVDINNIVARYRKTGTVSHVQRVQAKYGDFTDLFDVAGKLDKAAKANQAFGQLPAEMRNKFKNSISGFFEFIQDPGNRDQCVKWGIFNPPKADAVPDSAAEPAEPAPGSTKKGSMKKPPVITETEDGGA